MSNEQFEEFEELGRRAVACKMWRWMPGMMTCGGWRVIAISEGRSVCAKYDFVVISPEHDAIPDLTDPATVGCLLALVREAHGDPEIVVSKYEYSDGWTIGTQLEWEGIHSLWGSDGAIWGWSEAEVLVKALEGAP
jgi:hypothetical protein